MDSDDVLVPEALCVMYEVAKAENLDLLCFESDYVKEEENLPYTPFTFKKKYEGIFLGADLYKARHKNGDYCVVPWRNLLRTKMLTKNGFSFFEGIMDEDMISQPEFYFMAQRAKVLHKKLYVYRVRNNSVTQSQSHKAIFAFLSKLTVARELENLKEKYHLAPDLCARLDVSIRNRQRKLLALWKSFSSTEKERVRQKSALDKSLQKALLYLVENPYILGASVALPKNCNF